MTTSPEFLAEFKRLRDLPDGRLFVALIDCLATEHPVRNAVALELLTRVGPTAIPRLLREAFEPGRDSGHTIRILDAIEQMAEPLQREEESLLAEKMAHADQTLRAKIKQLRRRCPVARPDAQWVSEGLTKFNELMATNSMVSYGFRP